ncbi:MAG TPA: phosphoadenylyl-sulfate reductase [Candidatus Acidoferrales bacterium]|nr:phosphoadenylyl-sulfate reductase [Candidatus Acidoferrales bacterium]
MSVESQSIAPHGGMLVNRTVSPNARVEIRARAAHLPGLELTSRGASDLLLPATGAFSPLEGFMNFDTAPVLWSRKPDLYCELRKVLPLEKKLAELSAWITGIRREQAPTRANARKLEWHTKFGLVKLNPLADWSSVEVWEYIRANRVSYNPLHDQNYPSIGCTHCTRPVLPGEDPRAGRWAGFSKTECGLHGKG